MDDSEDDETKGQVVREDRETAYRETQRERESKPQSDVTRSGANWGWCAPRGEARVRDTRVRGFVYVLYSVCRGNVMHTHSVRGFAAVWLCAVAQARVPPSSSLEPTK